MPRPKSDGRSEATSPATSSSIGVWYPAQDDMLVVRANGALPSINNNYSIYLVNYFYLIKFLYFIMYLHATLYLFNISQFKKHKN